jgi:hypothetical protein
LKTNIKLYCIYQYFMSIREMGHQDVLKAFRSGATMESVLPRMSLIDSLTDIHQSTPEKINSTNENNKKSTREQLGLNLSPTDTTYIIESVCFKSVIQSGRSLCLSKIKYISKITCGCFPTSTRKLK